MDSNTRLSRLLINRDFALLWSGQAVSALGDAIFTITLILWTATSVGRGRPWAVLAVSGLSLAVAVPELAVGPIAGVFVDRWTRRTTMLRMDLLRAALIILLLPLTALRSTLPAQVSVGAVYAVLAGVTICSQFFSPSRLALIGDVVPPMHRARASSLSQVTLSLSLIAGPPIAAVLYFAAGVQWALLLNALSFGVSFLAIWLVRPGAHAKAAYETPPPGVLRELAAGLRFTTGNRPMRTVIITVAVAMLGGGSLNALGIFFVIRNLHAAPSSYGLLDGGYGAGVLAGAILSALLAQRLDVVRLFWLSVLLLGATFLAYSRLTAFWPAFLVLLAGGVPQATINVAIAPIMLYVTPRELVGRVSAILNPTVSLASILSVVLAGVLVSTVLRGFHADLLGMRFAAVDTVFTGAGVLLVVAGLYARASLRDLVLPPSGSPEKVRDT